MTGGAARRGARANARRRCRDAVTSGDSDSRFSCLLPCLRQDTRERKKEKEKRKGDVAAVVQVVFLFAVSRVPIPRRRHRQSSSSDNPEGRKEGRKGAPRSRD